MKSLVTTTVFAAALLSGGSAWAQSLGPNSDGPMDITADELEVQNKECISVWKGKAEALQGQARLRADVLKAVFQTKPGSSAGTAGTGACGDLIRIEAQGSVFYVTSKDQRVRGDAGTYDAAGETVTMTGDVVAVQGQNVLRGTRMVFNTKTGEGRMLGNSTGANAKSRPRGVFYPSKKQADAAK
ncbi:MAG: organic solvent tolerance protein OstA [Alphaproteobacteria bacterium]|nr:organic solvent tolerance protein OstA [Alphaproteobacteria bacterium]MBU1517061.1 organic solvent tolerance protein OstA [Alphaproteobacteria bacterium]MBU2093680.1 organic solvent tolerance protein OstA [Alphaproteobacteria bacterium]MBU2153998.1 organic solvent tolerance protein OstA [Alphaproteobacteria bacterium]MBU2308720.1 organic solvent tolerance protein OstA [Alphaproteobacteria bacterium]